MDALATVVSLLKPQAVGTKIIRGAGRWSVRYPAFGQSSFALVLKGGCWLDAEGIRTMALEEGDFVLFPATPGFTMASDRAVKAASIRTVATDLRVDEVFHGDATLEPSMSMLGGYFAFDPVNAKLLQGLLPGMCRIRATDPAAGSMTALAELIQREVRENRAGRELVLGRLVEVMLVEALRCAPAGMTARGLLAGLRDPKLAAALRAIHTETGRPWTLATLAREAAMSRSAFAGRFASVVGMTPLNYLLQWRIAVARNLLAREGKSVGETAFAVGYESASGFSTAFRRETGRSPKEFIGVSRGDAIPPLGGRPVRT